MYIVYLNLSFKSFLSSFALPVFVFVVAQYELNITGVSWYHTRKVEDELLTHSTEGRNNIQQKDQDHEASSIALPLALAGLAILLILMGCLGALFYIKKR